MPKSAITRANRVVRQVAALPVKVDAGRPVFLLVRTRTGRWTPPKGWPDEGAKDHRTAEREAFEEGGVTGRIKKSPLGAFRYFKRLANGRKVVCEALVFPLEVKAEHDDWPEKSRRRRKWFSKRKAKKRLGDDLTGLLAEYAAR
jgi:8-oxo-dGTP pyrophosphatase MutT (NUDIX family)